MPRVGCGHGPPLRAVPLHRRDDRGRRRAHLGRRGRAPGQIPAIRAYTFGPDLRLAAGSWDYAIVGDFDDADGWAAYDRHPDHEHFRSEVIGPHVAERCAVRFAL